MDKQAAFDKVARGIIAQGRPSVGEFSGGCVYVSTDGCRCGVGHLLPDDVEIPAHYNGSPVGYLPPAFLEKLGLPPRTSVPAVSPEVRFLERLQRCHDQAAFKPGMNPVVRETPEFLAEFKGLMARAAADHNLDPTALGEVV